MTEEERVVTGSQVEDNTQDYLAAINELKQNSVDRSKYDALKAENKRLIDSIVNGTDIGQVTVEEKESIEELRRKVNNPHQTNLDYWTNVLKLRDALIEEGYEDPFVGASSQYTPTLVDYDNANKVATVFKEMVEVADGDPDVFLNEYQRRVKDMPNASSNRQNKKK